MIRIQKLFQPDKRQWLVFTIVVVLFVGLYLSTMARYGVGFGDSDELIGVGYGLGVLHPPGYPVLNFLIYGITHLVPYGTIPFRAHLLAVGFQSLTLGIVFLLGNELLYQARKKRDSIGVWLPLVGVVGLGFSYLFWMYANVVEVFPFNNFLVILVVYLSVLLTSTDYLDKGFYSQWKLWIIFFSALGLMVGHHQTSWLILPGLLVLLLPIYSKNGRLFLSQRLGVGLGISVVVLVLSQLLLIWYSQNDSQWSWWMAPSMAGLVDHITRGAFGGVIIEKGVAVSSYLSAIDWNLSFNTLSHYVSVSLFSHWGVVWVLVMGMGGYFAVAKLEWRVWMGLGLMILLTGPILAAYLTLPLDDIQSIDLIQTLAITERMYLLGYVLFALLITFGLWFIADFLRRYLALSNGKYKRVVGWLAVGWMIVFGGFSLVHNYRGVNLREYDTIDAWAGKLLSSVDDDSLIVCFSDVSCFSLLLQQSIDKDLAGPYVMTVTPQINYPAYVEKENDYHRFGYQDSPFRIGDALSWSIKQNRDVYLAEVSQFYLEQLGLDGSAFGLEQGVMFDRVVCGKASADADRSQVRFITFDSTKIDQRNTFMRLHRLLLQPTKESNLDGWVCPSSYEHMQKAFGCLKNGDADCGLSHLYWATLKSPDDVWPRYVLAETYEKLDAAALAKREYTHILELEKFNASAAAALVRLNEVEDLPTLF